MTLFGIVIDRKKVVKHFFFLALGYFSYLMIWITVQYIPVDLNVAFLAIKQEEISWPWYQVVFFTHVYTSIFTLLFGLVQFSPSLRTRLPRIHRLFGKVYIGLILLLAGPSGFLMGYHANGGFSSQISFCLLSLLWIYFTWKAYAHARTKNWTRHKHFMYRSFALTLSAISLRLFKWMIAGTIALPPMDTYRIVSWSAWLVNLLLAELLIRYENRKNDSSLAIEKEV